MARKKSNLTFIIASLMILGVLFYFGSQFAVQTFDDYKTIEDWGTSDLAGNCKSYSIIGGSPGCSEGTTYGSFEPQICGKDTGTDYVECKNDKFEYNSMGSPLRIGNAVYLSNSVDGDVPSIDPITNYLLLTAWSSHPDINTMVSNTNLRSPVMIDREGVWEDFPSQGKRMNLKVNYDFYGKDIKVEWINSRSSHSNYQSMNWDSGAKLPGLKGGLDYGGGSDRHIYELVWSRIEPGKYYVNYDGQQFEGFDPTNGKSLSMSFNIQCQAYCLKQCSNICSEVAIKRIAYRYIFNCNIPENHFLGVETFAGGTEINADSLRYDVYSFCSEHPVIITDALEGGSTSSDEPYGVLAEGGSITIPDTQTYTLFYIFENDGSIPVIKCAEEEALDTETGTCLPVMGIVTICSAGVFDSESGLCVVQAESTVVCPDGGRYDLEKEVCIKEVETIVECPTDAYYDEAKGVCVYSPPGDVIISKDTNEIFIQPQEIEQDRPVIKGYIEDVKDEPFQIWRALFLILLVIGAIYGLSKLLNKKSRRKRRKK